MRVIAELVRAISGVNRIIGLTLAWLALAVVLVCFTVVVQRYFFRTTELWMQDLYVWLSGAMFTGVAGFALLRDDHVRVDILYRPWSVRKKAIADLFGVFVFLLPFVIVVGIYGWTFVARSWRLYEGSANIGGMPGLFILKSFIIVFCVLVGLLSALTHAGYVLFNQRAVARHSPWLSLALSMSFGALTLAVLGAIAGGPASLLAVGPGPTPWLIILGLALGPTLVGYALFTTALRHLPGRIASLIVVIEAPIATLAAVLLLGERLEAAQIAGMALILAAAVLPGLPLRLPRRAAATAD